MGCTIRLYAYVGYCRIVLVLSPPFHPYWRQFELTGYRLLFRLTDSDILRAASCSERVIAVCERDLISLPARIFSDRLLIPGMNPAQLLPNSEI